MEVPNEVDAGRQLHHALGVAMGQAGAERVDRPAERALAESIVVSQSAEITYLGQIRSRLQQQQQPS